jgi:hypothetical protein
MLGGGLALVLLGGLIGLGLVAGGVGALVYAAIGKNPRRAFIASAIAVGVSALAILVSLPFWSVVLSGRSTTGEKLDLAGSDFPLAVPVLAEGFVVCFALAMLVRRWGERRKARAVA